MREREKVRRAGKRRNRETGVVRARRRDEAGYYRVDCEQGACAKEWERCCVWVRGDTTGWPFGLKSGWKEHENHIVSFGRSNGITCGGV